MRLSPSKAADFAAGSATASHAVDEALPGLGDLAPVVVLGSEVTVEHFYLARDLLVGDVLVVGMVHDVHHGWNRDELSGDPRGLTRCDALPDPLL